MKIPTESTVGINCPKVVVAFGRGRRRLFVVAPESPCFNIPGNEAVERTKDWCVGGCVKLAQRFD